MNSWVSKIVGHGRVPPEALTANPLNHREHPTAQKAVLSASISELGVIKSIIVNRRTGLIVDGHLRVWEAQVQKDKIDREGGDPSEVLLDVEYVDLSPEDERKALLLLDASSEMATINATNLELLLDGVQTADSAIASLFETMALDAGIVDDGDLDEDDVPAVPVDPITKRGDVWLLGSHRLLCGDATVEADVARLVGSVECDLWLTDPPYNVDYVGKTSDALKVMNDKMSDSNFRRFLFDSFSLAFKSLRKGGVFYIWHADSEGLNFRGAVVDCGEKVRQCLIWKKNTMVMGRQDYHWIHEPCLTGVKEIEACVAESVRVGINAGIIPDQELTILEHEPCLTGWKAGGPHKWLSNRRQTTVLEFDRPSRSAEHPTMKPLAMIGYQIKNSCVPRGTVLDTFLGSGTTLIACEQLGRTCFGMELSPNYTDVVVKRWENLTGQKAVLETA